MKRTLLLVLCFVAVALTATNVNIHAQDAEKPHLKGNDCGTRFTQDTSANGNHQCPDCNKFGSKVSDCGCPECGEGELEQRLAVANN